MFGLFFRGLGSYYWSIFKLSDDLVTRTCERWVVCPSVMFGLWTRGSFSGREEGRGAASSCKRQRSASQTHWLWVDLGSFITPLIFLFTWHTWHEPLLLLSLAFAGSGPLGCRDPATAARTVTPAHWRVYLHLLQLGVVNILLIPLADVKAFSADVRNYRQTSREGFRLSAIIDK